MNPSTSTKEAIMLLHSPGCTEHHQYDYACERCRAGRVFGPLPDRSAAIKAGRKIKAQLVPNLKIVPAIYFNGSYSEVGWAYCHPTGTWTIIVNDRKGRAWVKYSNVHSAQVRLDVPQEFGGGQEPITVRDYMTKLQLKKERDKAIAEGLIKPTVVNILINKPF